MFLGDKIKNEPKKQCLHPMTVHTDKNFYFVFMKFKKVVTHPARNSVQQTK